MQCLVMNKHRKKPNLHVLGAVAAGALTVVGGAGLIYGVGDDATIKPHAPAAVSPAPTQPKCSQQYLPDPDPACTPGALNPNVTQANIKTTVCVPGWTKTVRPTNAWASKVEVQGIEDYGMYTQNSSDTELDHLIPLGLGGAPTDLKNLWPEPYTPAPGAHEKDTVERKLMRAVCTGKVTLAAAQDAIKGDWTRALTATGLATPAEDDSQPTASADEAKYNPEG